MVTPTAAALVESTAAAMAGGTDDWAATSLALKEQYRALAARAVAHTLAAAAGLATTTNREDLVALLTRLADEARPMGEP